MIPSRSLRSASRRQGGAILVFAVLGLSLAVILLSIADIGFLYYYKREYQKSADLAAMAGARGLAESLSTGGASPCTAANTSAQANKTQNLGNRGTLAVVTCGVWSPLSATAPASCTAASDLRLATPGVSEQPNAVRAYISGTPPHFLLPATLISACAIATASTPLAQLRIRNKLLVLNTQNSPLLNALVGGLLGGNVNLDALGWQGIANANVSLLDYLDAVGPLAGIDLSAGDYSALLGTQVSLLTIVDAAISAVGQNSTAGVSLGLLRSQIANLNAVRDQSIVLGDLLGLRLAKPGSEALGLNLNVFDMLQAGVQIANNQHAAAATVPINVPGIGTINVLLTVIEKPQPSVVGNPNIDDISVKTAQIRAYVSLNLSLLKILNQVVSVVQTLLSPILNLVNSTLSLNLGQILDGLIQFLFPVNCGYGLYGACDSKKVLDIQVVQDPIALAVDVGKATAKVKAPPNNYSCVSSGGVDKSLQVRATSAVAGLTLGKFSNANVNDKNSDFYKVTPQISPIEVLKIGELTVRPQKCWGLLIGIGNCENLQYATNSAATTWSSNQSDAYMSVKIGVRLGINNAPVLGGTPQDQVFQAPAVEQLPDLGGPTDPATQIYKTISPGGLISSLSSTLAGVTLDVYKTSTQWGGMEIVASLLGSILNLLVQNLLPVITNALGAVLDPLLSLLTTVLGIDLVTAEDAANMTCNAGATLVD